METVTLSDKVGIVPDGSVTTPRGFTAGAVHVGVRSDWDKLDVGIIASEVPCVAAATYTRNRVPGASLVLSKQHIAAGVRERGYGKTRNGRRGRDVPADGKEAGH